MAQNPTGQSTMTIPVEDHVQELATQLQLGNTKEVYVDDLPEKAIAIRNTVVRFVLGVFLIVAGFIIAISYAHFDLSGIAGLLGLAIPIALIGGIFFLLRCLVCLLNQLIPQIKFFTRIRPWVYIFEHGFIIDNLNTDTMEPFSLNEIKYFWRYVHKATINYSTTISCKHTIEKHDGHRYELNVSTTTFPAAANMSASLDTLIAQHIYPQAAQKLINGETLTFGQFSVNAQGICRQSDSLPWNEINKINIANGKFSIHKQGQLFYGERWAGSSVREIPNFTVFVSLINTIHQQYKNKTV